MKFADTWKEWRVHDAVRCITGRGTDKLMALICWIKIKPYEINTQRQQR